MGKRPWYALYTAEGNYICGGFTPPEGTTPAQAPFLYHREGPSDDIRIIRADARFALYELSGFLGTRLLRIMARYDDLGMVDMYGGNPNGAHPAAWVDQTKLRPLLEDFREDSGV